MGTTDKELEGPDLAAGVPFKDLREGEPLLGHAFGEPAIVVRAGADVLAIGATCTHYGGPLAEGLVAVDESGACTVRCPWHHACFDARTGAALGGPALNAVAAYEVERVGDLVRLGKKKPEWRGAAPGHAPDSVVIVGAGPAGAACAETLRRHGYAGPVVLIGSELPGPVDRPNLSKDYLAGKAPEEWIPLRGEDFYRELDVDFRAGETAVSIDRAARRIETDRGSIAYGAILLATGAEPIRLGIEGATLPHVHMLRTLADSRAIIGAVAQQGAKRAVVLGASFIGLEAAASLRMRGLDVTIVGPESVPLARVLGDELGALVRRIHEEQGEKFELGRKPAKIGPSSVTLDDGRELGADLVVMG
ncbi:MAG TPA: FAD-dependent oxidoreductase, partial [Polyangiaceae bacterium]|nr:FAD-dependent oxidoreductase [Polyangiaceae bacterium]